MPEIRREGEASATVAKELGSRLREFNETRVGPLNWKPVVLSIRNGQGDMIAGLSGATFWNCLFVDVLWVDEAHRGKDYGSSLLRYAERDAAEIGCDIVWLSTFAFQAPEFYARLGYTVIGQLEGSPRGSTRLWFAKHVEKHVV